MPLINPPEPWEKLYDPSDDRLMMTVVLLETMRRRAARLGEAMAEVTDRGKDARSCMIEGIIMNVKDRRCS